MNQILKAQPAAKKRPKYRTKILIDKFIELSILLPRYNFNNQDEFVLKQTSSPHPTFIRNKPKIQQCMLVLGMFHLSIMHRSFGIRAFVVCGPIAWNDLPARIRSCGELERFQRYLKDSSRNVLASQCN